MSIATRAWTTTPLPPGSPQGRGASSGSKSFDVRDGAGPRVIDGSVLSDVEVRPLTTGAGLGTSASDRLQSSLATPAQVRGNVRRLFSNDRAESLPLWGWAAWGVWSQVHRLLSGQRATAFYVMLAVICLGLAVACAQTNGKSAARLFPVCGWAFGLLAWTAWAVAGGLSIELVVTWFLLLILMYLPLLRAVLTLKYAPVPAPVVMGGPMTVFEEPVDPFAGWLKGAREDGPRSPTPTGFVQRIQIPEGADARQVCSRTAAWANHYKVSPDAIEAVPVPDRGDLIDVYAHHINVHAQTREPSWLYDEVTDFYAPMDFGGNRNGGRTGVEHAEAHTLVAGQTRSGKSGIIRSFVLYAAKDPYVRLYLLDGKNCELAPFEKRATHYSGSDIDPAIAVMRKLVSLAKDRQKELNRDRLFKAHSAEPGRYTREVLIVDELEVFSACRDARKRDEFNSLLGDLITLGGAAGVNIILGTQRPTKEVVPRRVSSACANAIATRCGTAADTRVIFGENTPLDASVIPFGPKEHGGKCLLRDDPSGRVVRADWVDDQKIWEVVKDLPHAPVVIDRGEPETARQPLRSVGPRFPDGTAVPQGWPQDVWQLLVEGPAKVSEVRAAIPAAPTDGFLKKRLEAWESRGWLVAGRSGNAATYRRTDVEAVA